MIRKIEYTLYTLTVLLLTPAFLFASSHGGGDGLRGGGSGTVGIKNPIKSESIQDLLNAILDIFIRVGTPIIVLAFIYVGFRFVEARGNSTKIEVARRALLYTVIGTAVLLGAQAISMLLSNTINLL